MTVNRRRKKRIRIHQKATGLGYQAAMNRFGLMGDATADRSEVLPFSLMMFDDEEGWQQYGVYETRELAQQSIESFKSSRSYYTGPLAVVDTNALLDWTESNDTPLMDLASICPAKGVAP